MGLQWVKWKDGDSNTLGRCFAGNRPYLDIFADFSLCNLPVPSRNYWWCIFKGFRPECVWFHMPPQLCQWSLGSWMWCDLCPAVVAHIGASNPQDTDTVGSPLKVLCLSGGCGEDNRESAQHGLYRIWSSEAANGWRHWQASHCRLQYSALYSIMCWRWRAQLWWWTMLNLVPKINPQQVINNNLIWRTAQWVNNMYIQNDNLTCLIILFIQYRNWAFCDNLTGYFLPVKTGNTGHS